MVFSSGEGIKGPFMPIEKSKTLMVQLYFARESTAQHNIYVSTHTHIHSYIHALKLMSQTENIKILGMWVFIGTAACV